MNFNSWLETAASNMAKGIPPHSVIWHTDTQQPDLFGTAQPLEKVPALVVTPDFLKFARIVACHRDERKWALLYNAVWRIAAGEPHLLNLVTDAVVRRLRDMEHQIRRDAHKAKAFVRFRRVQEDGEDHYVAWHQPDHHILRIVAPFFQRRFSAMRWSILTPDESVFWDGDKLQFAEGYPEPIDIGDESFENLWRVYYRSTFNPARIKIKMMKKEMPVRYWHTMPETALIPQMLAEAQNRVTNMISATDGFNESAERFLPVEKTYDSLREAAAHCEGCPLHCDATQTVFGAGRTDAPPMLVGEQPGDMEDLEGKPFIGPSGEVLDHILNAIQIPRNDLYITNAVKHFKFEARGKRRIHKSPHPREINACKPWLAAEIDLIKPRAIVTLGVTAGRALIHHGFALKNAQGRDYLYKQIPVIPTWHPSAILRAPDDRAREKTATHLADSVTKAAGLILKPSSVSSY